MRAATADGELRSLLADLPLGTDRAWVDALRTRVGGLPPKPLRVLLVTHATMKYQEKAVLTFFAHAPLSACDAWLAGGRVRSLRPPLAGVRYVGAAEAREGRYDRVIGFDASGAFVEQCAHHGCAGAFVGKVRERHTAATREALRRLAVPVRAYATHASLPEAAGLDDFFGPGRWAAGGAIDFPPNLDLHLAAPAVPRFPCVLLGGGDRDYAFAVANADRLPGPVVVTHSDVPPAARADRAALEAMRSDPRFRVLPWLPELDYARVLLHARLVFFPVHGAAKGDYTSIADAAWYGRPVLTHRVAATAHVEDRVLFYDGPDALAARVRELEDPERWREASDRARDAARRKCDLFALLERVYRDL